MDLSHVQRVRMLYKTVLKLNRGLPVELQVMGNSYVREEFKRHKNCNIAEAQVFLVEWTVSFQASIFQGKNFNLNLESNLGALDSIIACKSLLLFIERDCTRVWIKQKLLSKKMKRSPDERQIKEHTET